MSLECGRKPEYSERKCELHPERSRPDGGFERGTYLLCSHFPKVISVFFLNTCYFHIYMKQLPYLSRTSLVHQLFFKHWSRFWWTTSRHSLLEVTVWYLRGSVHSQWDRSELNFIHSELYPFWIFQKIYKFWSSSFFFSFAAVTHSGVQRLCITFAHQERSASLLVSGLATHGVPLNGLIKLICSQRGAH